MKRALPPEALVRIAHELHIVVVAMMSSETALCQLIRPYVSRAAASNGMQRITKNCFLFLPLIEEPTALRCQLRLYDKRFHVGPVIRQCAFGRSQPID